MAALIRVIASASVLASIAFSAAMAQPAACDRRCLEGFVERYLDALVRHDPRSVPLAASVRYTENGQRLSVGDGLWRSVKNKGKYQLAVADAEAQQVALIGTLEEQNADPLLSTPAVIALRLKIRANEITEIEQFIARNVDAAKRIEALGRPHALFTQAVPEAERMSRAELVTTANKYFTGMQQNDGKGDYPFAADCNRIENGMQTTNRPTPAGETRPDPKTAASYSAQWSSREQFASGLLHFVTRIRDRRFVALDPERGEIRRIEATLERVPYGMTSGWSSWEDGMSDRARDVTR
jgi:hypothetical protein